MCTPAEGTPCPPFTLPATPHPQGLEEKREIYRVWVFSSLQPSLSPALRRGAVTRSVPTPGDASIGTLPPGPIKQDKQQDGAPAVVGGGVEALVLRIAIELAGRCVPLALIARLEGRRNPPGLPCLCTHQNRARRRQTTTSLTRNIASLRRCSRSWEASQTSDSSFWIWLPGL